MYFVLFFVLSCLSTCHCLIDRDENEKHCGLPKQWLESTSVSVEIGQKGFHREVATTVELSPAGVSEVRVLLIHRWPRGVFVDPYQLTFLSNQSDWLVLLDSAIDLEVPAHKTSGFVTYVYPTLDGPIPRVLKVAIPIHGRYHEPSFAGNSFTSVNIEPPELLLRINKCVLLNNVEPHIVVDAPCTAENSSTCSWVKIQQQQKQEQGPMSLQLPVGDGSLVTAVCCGTLIVTMICCVALSRYMWKHQI
ncbi:phosphatidylinositol-glycan biosynthesis class X protein [Mastacembelus armatus]|uniref:Phosphatidylinositol-glycan biosynthesis class X protein n=1 Tax=Mastacembelus armatus TaxID=205130 RepID=A0A3Q3SFY6_9TELE|nr:phosphatidylinositol-glycan biosynthesis class X protein [Mastacembelus armatus]